MRLDNGYNKSEKMKTTILLFLCLLFLTIKNPAQTVTDIDGNVYNIITIGTQVWFKENLKVSHYRNGDPVPNVTDNSRWAGLTTGAFCNYENNASFTPTYGRLYNWFAVADSREICPADWHVATDAEWTVLTDLLGGEAGAGGKLKEAGTEHWASPNAGATNEVDFTALPGGYRANNEIFIGIHHIGSWWCSTENGPANGWARGIFNDATTVDRGGYYEKKMGFSVRCIKDATTRIHDIKINGDIQIYPNPASEVIKITCHNSQITNVRIYNLIGECILQKDINSRNGELLINSLSGGIYIIEIKTKDSATQRKLIRKQ